MMKTTSPFDPRQIQCHQTALVVFIVLTEWSFAAEMTFCAFKVELLCLGESTYSKSECINIGKKVIAD